MFILEEEQGTDRQAAERQTEAISPSCAIGDHLSVAAAAAAVAATLRFLLSGQDAISTEKSSISNRLSSHSSSSPPARLSF
jgi:hypothetical protein